MKKLKGYIHDFDEALLVMHCIRLGIFCPETERLSVEHRNSIKSGSIFCFIESENGMKRWTDGKIWSPSKIVGQFLLYKEVPRHLSKSALKKLKKNKIKRDRATIEYGNFENGCNNNFNLFKKTISITYENKIYHIISYFQPIFDRRGIKQLPFFKALQSIILAHPELLKDSTIENLNITGKSIYDEYKIPIPNINVFVPDIDRSELEKQVASILQFRMNLKIIQ
ncbi:cAMP-independent regulatory protein pac2 [Astathelohania contejeani]|uniref:cAMP-independent regulatory protein pac2 n=1 Tax=Astathelohania contejeani TaxID=164912 RepID=A0ABQ7HWF0_9MICR|nr:cAMP-independent regulatory protein pac2 [Thelohania contejeani]